MEWPLELFPFSETWIMRHLQQPGTTIHNRTVIMLATDPIELQKQSISFFVMTNAQRTTSIRPKDMALTYCNCKNFPYFFGPRYFLIRNLWSIFANKTAISELYQLSPPVGKNATHCCPAVTRTTYLPELMRQHDCGQLSRGLLMMWFRLETPWILVDWLLP